MASYLDYEPPTVDDSSADVRTPAAEAAEAAENTAPTTWMGGGRAVPASPELMAAQTPEQALEAAERIFFGEVKRYG